MKVKEVIHTPAGETVLDFGQNFAGYVQFHCNLKKGTKIVLDYGEILQHGNFYNANYKTAKAHFIYVSNGKDEIVKPQFTYYGFRYVRVTGWEGDINKDDFVGKALYSTMAFTGHIETGYQKLNQLFSNVFWGQRSNFVDFPTDCPQRDERLGWTADCQVFCGTASFNMYTPAFYDKFIHDLRVEQNKYDGSIPCEIPVFNPGMAAPSAVWGDCATILPTVVYERFGDICALKSYYPMMKDWVDKIRRGDQERGEERYLYDYSNQFGDWVALDGRTSQSFKGGTDENFIASCYYAMSAKMVSDAAKVLGKEEDATYYLDLHDKIKAAVLKEYFTESGRLAIDTQTGYIVALYTNIYRNKEKLITDFYNRLYKDCYSIKGGFVGAPIMCKVMADNGLADVAFHFLLQDKYPGWMHCIDLGATTIWERWNSVLDDGLLSGIKMNSLNHYAFGSVIEFLYRNVAGLHVIEPGFKKTLIQPNVNATLRFFKCSYESAHGLYRVEWEISKDGNLHFLIEVPIDCSAVVELPYYPKNEKIELDSGIYNFDYKPTKDVRSKYTTKSLFYYMLNDEKAMNIIQKITPPLYHILKSGDVDCMYENLESLKEMFYLGFTPDQISQLTTELTTLSCI